MYCALSTEYQSSAYRVPLVWCSFAQRWVRGFRAIHTHNNSPSAFPSDEVKRAFQQGCAAVIEMLITHADDLNVHCLCFELLSHIRDSNSMYLTQMMPRVLCCQHLRSLSYTSSWTRCIEVLPFRCVSAASHSWPRSRIRRYIPLLP